MARDASHAGYQLKRHHRYNLLTSMDLPHATASRRGERYSVSAAWTNNTKLGLRRGRHFQNATIPADGEANEIICAKFSLMTRLHSYESVFVRRLQFNHRRGATIKLLYHLQEHFAVFLPESLVTEFL